MIKKKKCPLCGGVCYVYEHTPATDHPERLTGRWECNDCDWQSDEWPVDAREEFPQKNPGGRWK